MLVDFKTTKLFVYMDGSFANIKDCSSQIGYGVFLVNELKLYTKILFATSPHTSVKHSRANLRRPQKSPFGLKKMT